MLRRSVAALARNQMSKMNPTDVDVRSDFAKGKASFAFIDGTCVKDPDLPEKVRAVCVYEVFKVHKGKPCYLDQHLARLRHSCESVKFAVDTDAIKAGVDEVVKACELTNQNIKILLAREEGKDGVRVFAYPVESFYPPLDYYEKGVVGEVIEYIREDPTSKILDMKLKQKLEEAKARGVFELLLSDKEGNILEGTRSNVFCIIDGKLHTAPSDRVVQGVTRDRVLDLCTKNSVPVTFTPLTVRLLKNASSVFLTSTSNGILPFSAVDTFHYNIAGDKVLQNLMMEWFSTSE
ncbi:Branched-chain amino acid aminotransferase/4-amino-4-deoxychorismate lyase [Diplonema papillatum]|nr:Branched-chain amino acid aminotransferase/4-amino-4-deoxychorismate lyase [Diplonema papillatum]KAJ9460588.1 Branched-chain amino acid aminotransferase/4-amino-4-deoxychorismate lyase [Diplonema papillatum]